MTERGPQKHGLATAVEWIAIAIALFLGFWDFALKGTMSLHLFSLLVGIVAAALTSGGLVVLLSSWLSARNIERDIELAVQNAADRASREVMARQTIAMEKLLRAYDLYSMGRQEQDLDKREALLRDALKVADTLPGVRMYLGKVFHDRATEQFIGAKSPTTRVDIQGCQELAQKGLDWLQQALHAKDSPPEQIYPLLAECAAILWRVRDVREYLKKMAACRRDRDPDGAVNWVVLANVLHDAGVREAAETLVGTGLPWSQERIADTLQRAPESLWAVGLQKGSGPPNESVSSQPSRPTLVDLHRSEKGEWYTRWAVESNAYFGGVYPFDVEGQSASGEDASNTAEFLYEHWDVFWIGRQQPTTRPIDQIVYDSLDFHSVGIQ